MKRGWFLLLALSIGLNAGLLISMAMREWKWGSAPPPAPVSCNPFGRGDPMGRGDMPASGVAEKRIQCLSKRLQLDESQQSEMVSILKEMMPRILHGRGMVRDARRSIHDEYRKVEPDPDRIRAITHRLNESQSTLDSLVADTILRETALLTPEQRTLYFNAMPWDRGGRPGPDRYGRPPLQIPPFSMH